MPSYIVTCKQDATAEDVERVKQQVRDQGGQIGHEYALIKGFQAIYPEGTVQTLGEHEHVQHVEEDAEVRTQ
ncbi:uncharacterized protein B0T15DRAFT_527562 [Chaetomium strumarium]|uniref:Inhibitor I9 domain-containing protein n=1 Tax=Chaetomium strumarium TaxID=1170767 RepID=A0AAJ0M2Q4_9PEZI|nr:hypothetical protein B0T15DRAFT_527562 [Chaetomium strumarium]